jgi:broad specificity phosphatase PhoE
MLSNAKIVGVAAMSEKGDERLPARRYLVRHGESEVNVDVPVRAYSTAKLTSRGRLQAERLAMRMNFRPTMVRSSTFVCARDTAAVLLDLCGTNAAIIEPALVEFTYLDPAFADGSTRAERAIRARAFWARSDANYRDGRHAETFAEFESRVRWWLSCRIESESHDVAVTHGMVITLAALIGSSPAVGLRPLFSAFIRHLLTVGVIPNCGVVEVPCVGT